MTQKERIARQRSLAQEALGKLKAVSEYFGVAENDHHFDMSQLHDWEAKIKKLENWIFDESPIA